MLHNSSNCEYVLKAIRAIIRAIDLQSKTIDQNCGLTGPQLILLKEVALHGKITTSKLAKHASISQSTATLIIDRLVSKNLAERTRDTVDKRKWFITLTSQGKEILKNAPTLLQSSFIDQFETLPVWDQTQILSTLQRVVAMLNAQTIADDSAPIIASSNYELV